MMAPLHSVASKPMPQLGVTALTPRVLRFQQQHHDATYTVNVSSAERARCFALGAVYLTSQAVQAPDIRASFLVPVH